LCVNLEGQSVFLYTGSMKKQLYFSIIGIGAILAIIGFIPGGMSGTWGILIAGVTAALYFINTRNDQKVQDRLAEERGMFERDANASSEEDSGE
jgi:hypothetical protein